MLGMVPLQAILFSRAYGKALADVAKEYPDHVEVAKYFVGQNQDPFAIVRLLHEEIPLVYAAAAVKVAGGKI